MINLTEKPFYLKDEQIDWVNSTLAMLSNKQKAGQLFCVLGNLYEDSELEHMAEEYCIGGVLFRPYPRQELQDRFSRLDRIASVPLLKAANLEEGGNGAISDGTQFATQMQVAATGDADMARKLAMVCTAEGRSAGINWTFSPVADIDYNFMNPITNVRTFGSDPEQVLAFTKAYAETVQKNGIAACAKHYPGDGVDYRDHHLHPTYNTLSAEEWYGTYGKIYQALIDDGIMSVMAGHIVQPNVQKAINPQAEMLPASMSRELITDVLREKFGFNGLVTTDATIMGGYCMSMNRKNTIVSTIAAGCDMLVFNTDFYEDHQAILDALESGHLSQERLDEAVTRILAMKAKVCFPTSVPPIAKAEIWRKSCADKSVTLVKYTDSVLPVTPNRYPIIRLIILGNDSIPDGSITGIAAEQLITRGFEVEVSDIGNMDLKGSRDIRDTRLTLYLTNVETKSDQTTARIFWNPKFALDLPRYVDEEAKVFVSFANPYHLQDVPRVKAYINAYTANIVTITAVIEKLTGESGFYGISPVDAFCGLADTRL